MKGFDYSSNNIYFVTICVQDKVCCFGSVISVGTGRDLSVNNPNASNKIMELNEFGNIVSNRILWLANQYEYIEIHNFIVMPNHVHIIIEIDSMKLKSTSENISIKIKSLSSVIGAFKTTSSKLIHLSGYIDFAWQRSFHDHIIRNEMSYLNITNYIDVNPDKWNVDTFFESN